MKNPSELVSYVIEEKYAHSTAEWEHKAFLFSKSKNLMVIPGSLNDYKNPQNSFNGAFVFHIKRNGNYGSIKLRGIINHIIGKEDQFYERSVERSLYIEELLYTKSRCLIRVNTLDHLNSVVNLPLTCETEPLIIPRPLPTPIFIAEVPLQKSDEVQELESTPIDMDSSKPIKQEINT